MRPSMNRHNVITREAARLIFNKVESMNVPLAVFSANGSWTAAKINTTSFARQIQQKPDTLCGIYDIMTRLEWIEDDLAEVGIK